MWDPLLWEIRVSMYGVAIHWNSRLFFFFYHLTSNLALIHSRKGISGPATGEVLVPEISLKTKLMSWPFHSKFPEHCWNVTNTWASRKCGPCVTGLKKKRKCGSRGFFFLPVVFTWLTHFAWHIEEYVQTPEKGTKKNKTKSLLKHTVPHTG